MRVPRLALAVAVALWIGATLFVLRAPLLRRWFPAQPEPRPTASPEPAWICPKESRAIGPLHVPPCSLCDMPDGCCANHCSCALCCRQELEGDEALAATCEWRCRTWAGSVRDGRTYVRPDRPHCFLGAGANAEPPRPRLVAGGRPPPALPHQDERARPPAATLKSAPAPSEPQSWLNFGHTSDEEEEKE